MHREQLQRLRKNINRVIVGKEEVTELLLTALLAPGNCLIDDVPAWARRNWPTPWLAHWVLILNGFSLRPICSPLTSPEYILQSKEGEFQFRPGPVFTNILLADEINRAVPRTQSSLLEAMEEQQVSIEGGTIFRLAAPFMVIATQNPLELEGTFPLPEAQLDRFLLKIEMGYPSLEQEAQILARFKEADPMETLEPVLDGKAILQLREAVKQVRLSPDLMDYIARLSQATRENSDISLGLSPRGSLALMRSALAYAYLQDRAYVLPDDLKYLFPPYVASHRLILEYESEYAEDSKPELIRNILAQVPVPVEDVLHG